MIMSREETIFGEDWPYSKAKSALLKAAAVVIREEGPRSATLKNIAGKAGVTEPAIFRHFDGVDGVFQSMATVVEMFYGKFLEYFQVEGAAGLERLEAAWVNMLETVKDNPEFIYALAKPDPIFRQFYKLRSRIEEAGSKCRAAVVECLKEAKAAGQLLPAADPETASAFLLGATLLLLYSWADDIAGCDPLKEGKRILAAWLASVRLPGSEPAAPKAKPSRKKA